VYRTYEASLRVGALEHSFADDNLVEKGTRTISTLLSLEGVAQWKFNRLLQQQVVNLLKAHLVRGLLS
jgi:hypothetical protein